MSNEINEATNKPGQDQELDQQISIDSEEPTEQTETLDTADEIEQDNNTNPNISAQVEALEAENNQLKDSMLRAQAEMQNVRLRAEKDVEKARKYALEKFVSALLPVADNLERALDAADQENDSQKNIIEGVELTLKSLQDTLKQFGIEPINPQDEPFDPQLHQAMSMVPNPDVEPNTILNVFQKGYRLNGRLIRPAMVVVSSGQADTQQ